MDNLKGFGLHFKYSLKGSLREPAMLFWTMVYPILLVTFFYLAFSKVLTVEAEPIAIAVEATTSGQETIPYQRILEQIPMFAVQATDLPAATELLKEGQVVAVINRQGNLVVKDTGPRQTIVRRVMNRIRETVLLGQEYSIDVTDIPDSYAGRNMENMNEALLPFVVLLGMFSIYSMFGVDYLVSVIQANRSEIGKRFYLSPVKKSVFVLSSVASALVLNFFSNILVVLYIRYVLQMSIISNIGMTLVVMLLGNIFGVGFGMFLTTATKLADGIRSGLMVGISLLLSFLSGMMSVQIKQLVMQKVPFVNQFNPVEAVSNSIVRINIYDNYDKLTWTIGLMIGYSVLLIGVSVLFLRRRRYDSI